MLSSMIDVREARLQLLQSVGTYIQSFSQLADLLDPPASDFSSTAAPPGHQVRLTSLNSMCSLLDPSWLSHPTVLFLTFLLKAASPLSVLLCSLFSLLSLLSESISLVSSTHCSALTI